MIKLTFSDTILASMLPFVISISDINDWVKFLIGIASFVLIVFKIIDIKKGWKK